MAVLYGAIATAVGNSDRLEPSGDRPVEEQITAPIPERGRGAPPPPRVERKPGALEDGEQGLGELGLIRQHDGTYLYVDPHARFSARFEANGTVSFADRWRRPSRSDSQHGRCCGKPPGGLPGINPFYGARTTGPAEWILKLRGVDIFGKAKRDLLARTRDLRVRLAVAHNLELLERRLDELEPELLELWSDHTVDVQRRRELLFLRWDECEEYFEIDPGDVPGEAILTIDRAQLETAEEARRKIERFIRRHLPRGSKHAYGRAELRRLNARRTSSQQFTPYDRRPKTTRK